MVSNSSNIKEKKEINANPDSDVWIKPITKPRSQEIVERRQQRANPMSADLKPLANKMQFVREESIQPSGDIPTVTSKELQDSNETRNNLLYRNNKASRTTHVH